MTKAFRRAHGRALVLPLATVLATLLITDASRAARPASEDELREMTRATGFDPRCMAATVSTVDGAWGVLKPLAEPPTTCQPGNGFVVLRHDSIRWNNVYEGSERFACPVAAVPVSVGKDLDVCRAARTYVLCLPRDETLRVVRVRPRNCTTLGPRDGYAGAASLVNLRWRNWGKAVATARGTERGFKLPLQRIPVRVVASRRRLADCGDYVYTRLKFSSRYGTTRQRVPATCGDHEDQTDGAQEEAPLGEPAPPGQERAAR